MFAILRSLAVIGTIFFLSPVRDQANHKSAKQDARIQHGTKADGSLNHLKDKSDKAANEAANLALALSKLDPELRRTIIEGLLARE